MSIEQQRNEYIESLEGQLTPEQAAHLLEMGEGDTGTPPDKEAEPAAPAATGDQQKPGEADPDSKEQDPAAPDESTLNSDNAVIIAKDGKHTIEYKRLEEAREQRDYWKGQAEAINAELARLQAEAQQRRDAGIAPTATDRNVAIAEQAIEHGADPSLFGDYSDEAMAKGVAKLVDLQMDAKINAALDKRIKPLEQQQQVSAIDAHDNAIYAAHPDLASIVESREFHDWINKLPKIMHAVYYNVLERGTAEQVIEVFDTYKAANDVTQKVVPPRPDLEQARAAAKKAVEAAPSAVPSSLSDIPGGRAGGQGKFEQMATMDGVQLLEAMDNMSKEQIDRYLNQTI